MRETTSNFQVMNNVHVKNVKIYHCHLFLKKHMKTLFTHSTDIFIDTAVTWVCNVLFRKLNALTYIQLERITL